MSRFLVVDLEATCDEGVVYEDSETIEIGAVLLNDNFETIGEFSKFVRPVKRPILTAFCQRLTGISQSQVDASDTFLEVFTAFVAWCSRFGKFCSWGSWDQKQLRRDCDYNSFIYSFKDIDHVDLARLSRRKYGCGQRRLFKRLGVETTGRRHRGIDDARNYARLMPFLFGG